MDADVQPADPAGKTIAARLYLDGRAVEPEFAPWRPDQFGAGEKQLSRGLEHRRIGLPWHGRCGASSERRRTVAQCHCARRLRERRPTMDRD
jgi:hypothetical protein